MEKNFYEKDEREIEEEIEIFLFKIYDITEDKQIIFDRKNNSKRMKLSHEVTDKKINLERTRRLITHLCNLGKYEFLYNTFKNNYLDIWTNNLKLINNHELLRLIEGKEQVTNTYLEDFLLKTVFDTVSFDLESLTLLLYDYITNFAKLWCHHKRSTEIICNVYLYFDCMYKHFKKSIIDDLQDEYIGFFHNANLYLRKVIMGNLNKSDNKTEIQEYEKIKLNEIPVSVTSVLFSIFYILNYIRDNYFDSNNSNDTNKLNKKDSFFLIKKLFEMLIQLEIFNTEIKRLYIKISRAYYLKTVDNMKKNCDLKDYLLFVRKVIEFEKQLLLTQNNMKIIQEDGPHNYNLNNSLLSFIKYNKEIISDGFNINDNNLRIGVNNVGGYKQIGWDVFINYMELEILEVLVSDDLIMHYSIKNNCNSLTQLVLTQDFEILKFMFSLFKKKNKEEQFRKEFEKCIVEQSLILCNKLICCKSENEISNKSNKYVSYLNNIQELLEFHLNIEQIWKNSFSENEKIRNLCINESWIRILNYSDNISKELMRGFSLFLYQLFFICDKFNYGKSNYICEAFYRRLSRVNMEIINWNTEDLISSFFHNNENFDFISEEIKFNFEKLPKDENSKLINIKKYIDSIIYLFKCSNYKEHFQYYYYNLLSQRLIFNYIHNKMGFGGDVKNITNYYLDWIFNSATENIDMLSNQLNVFEMYFLKLIYNECGYTFINKFNFIIKDWFTSVSIFKFYLLRSVNKTENNQYIEFPHIDERIKIINDSSLFFDNINSWLKSEDLNSCNEMVSSVNINSGSKVSLSDIETKQEKEEIENELVLRKIHYKIPFSILVLSSANWPLINNNKVNFIDSELFSKNKNNLDIYSIYNEIDLYQQFYKKIYSRTLCWPYSLGICILDLKIKRSTRNSIKLILTLQQAILLLCFNEKKEIFISNKEFLLLKDNINKLFGKNIILLRDKNRNIIDQIEVPSILNLQNSSNSKDEDIKIELNDYFFEYIDNNSTLHFGEFEQFLLNYTSSYEDRINTAEFHTNYYLDSVINENDNFKENKSNNEIRNKNHLNFDYESITNNFIFIFKNNKYRLEATIMKYLKHRQKSTLSNLIELVINEFSINISNNQDKKLINEEILKCLNSLIQRDLIEIDPENDQFYNYVP